MIYLYFHATKFIQKQNLFKHLEVLHTGARMKKSLQRYRYLFNNILEMIMKYFGREIELERYIYLGRFLYHRQTVAYHRWHLPSF